MTSPKFTHSATIQSGLWPAQARGRGNAHRPEKHQSRVQGVSEEGAPDDEQRQPPAVLAPQRVEHDEDRNDDGADPRSPRRRREDAREPHRVHEHEIGDEPRRPGAHRGSSTPPGRSSTSCTSPRYPSANPASQ